MGTRIYLTALLLLLPATALGQAEVSNERLAEARDAFLEGTRAYEAGEFEAALTRFQRAYELTEDPAVAYNIATVADRLRRDDIALEAYEHYLEGDVDAEDRANVEARIEALRAALARSAETADAVEPRVIVREVPSSMSAPSEGAGPAPWVVVAVGGAVGLVGGILLGVAAADVQRVEGATRGSMWQDYRESFERSEALSVAGITLLAIGGAALLAGLTWGLITLGDGEEGDALSLRLGPGGLALRGTF